MGQSFIVWKHSFGLTSAQPSTDIVSSAYHSKSRKNQKCSKKHLPLFTYCDYDMKACQDAHRNRVLDAIPSEPLRRNNVAEDVFSEHDSEQKESILSSMPPHRVSFLRFPYPAEEFIFIHDGHTQFPSLLQLGRAHAFTSQNK